MKSIILVIVMFFLTWIPQSMAEDTTLVTEGSSVTIGYTATIEDEVVDTATEENPLTFVVGQGIMIDGFEQAITGMHEGETKTFVVAPEDAYGEYDPDAHITLSRSQLPEGIELHVGSVITLTALDNYPVTVKEVDNDTVLLDANHEFAGKEIKFVVTVIDVE